MALQKFALLFDVKPEVISDATLTAAYGEIPIFRVEGQHILNDKADKGISNAMRLYGYDPVDPTRDLLVQWNLRQVLLRHTKDMEPALRDAIMNEFPGYNGGTQWLYGSIAREEFGKSCLEKVALYDNNHITLCAKRAANSGAFPTGTSKGTRTERFYGDGVSYNQDGFSKANLEKYIDTDGKSLYEKFGSAYQIPGFQCIAGLFLLCEARVSTKHNGTFYVASEYENLSKFSSFGVGGSKRVKHSADNSPDTAANFTPAPKVTVKEVDLPTFVNMVTLAKADIATAQTEGVIVEGVKYMLKA